MSDIALLWSTFANSAEAERIAGTLLAERLVACVNILAPCTSIYRWQNGIERSSEVPALFKTSTALVEAARARIDELHGYDLPVIEAWPASATDAVAAWIAADTGA